MSRSRLTVADVRRCVERQAYAYGVSEAVSTLLGEYVTELITQQYVRRKKEQLVPGSSR